MGDSSEPPTYGTPAVLSPLLLNIRPLNDAINFQTGEFGDALDGFVECKADNSDRTIQPTLDKLQLTFSGVESRGGQEIVLYESSVVLWENRFPSTSSSGNFPPSSIPFTFALTPDIPHCIHLARSSLVYSLSATVFYPSLPPLSRTVPIHLSRYSSPSPITSSHFSSSSPTISSHIESIEDPVAISVSLPKEAFRRQEAIPIVMRIAVPPAASIRGGLRLRNISAELIRKIVVTSPIPTSPPLTTHSDIQEIVPPPPPVEEPHFTLLAKSGKSCRFSPSRPIVIRLLLHPPVDVSCESISQSSMFHDVSFFVKTTISLFSLPPSPPLLPPVIIHCIRIIPDSPRTAPPSRTATTNRSEKERAVEQEEIPSYRESAGESSSSAMMNALPGGSMVQEKVQEQEEEEEFDGYENFSTDLVMPPPPIEDDVSPPTVEAASSLPPSLAQDPVVVESSSIPISLELPSSLESETLLVSLIDLATAGPRALPLISPLSPGSIAPHSASSDDHSTPPPYFGDSAPVARPGLATATSTSGPPPYYSSHPDSRT